jgi:hypothetical protein
MADLLDAADKLVETAIAPSASYEDASEAAREVLETAGEYDEAFDDALRILLEAVRAEDPERAGIAGVVCGALVERGADAEIAAEHVAERYAAVARTASNYLGRCREYFQENILGDDACEICGPDDDEQDIMMPDVRLAVSENMPEGEGAWIALDLLSHPTVTMLCRTPDVRRQFGRDTELVNRIGALAAHQSSAYYVWALLSLLDEEPLLVIDPKQRKGFEIEIDGVGDNFQLHLLLADTLYGDGHLEGEAPEEAVASVARGDGPPVIDEYVVGFWNLYNWVGLSPDGELPDGYFDQGTRYWIWNEGVPADIQKLDDTRIVLLGPTPYIRQWQPSRLFPNLRARADVVRVLDDDEVGEWLDRISSRTAELREDQVMPGVHE